MVSIEGEASPPILGARDTRERRRRVHRMAVVVISRATMQVRTRLILGLDSDSQRGRLTDTGLLPISARTYLADACDNPPALMSCAGSVTGNLPVRITRGDQARL
jgi:hypothetical protein